MTLQKQLVHLNLTGGLQKKDDDKLVIPTKLTVADNVEFDDASTVIRRGGQAALGSGGSAAAVRMYEHDGVVHLELSDGTHIRRTAAGDYKFSDLTIIPQKTPSANARLTATAARLQGFNVNPPDVSYYRISRRGFDVAVGTSTYCMVWEDTDTGGSALGCKLSIRRTDSNVEVFGTTIEPGTTAYGTKPRVMWDSTNSRYIVLYAAWLAASTSYDINGFAISETGTVVIADNAIATITGATIVGSAADTDICFDAAISAGHGFMLAARDTNSDINSQLFDLGLSSLTTLQTTTQGTIYAVTAHATYSGGVLTGHVFYGNSVDVRGRTLPSNTGTISAEHNIATTAFTGGYAVQRIAVADNGSNLLLVADVFGTGYGTAGMLGQSVMTISTAHVLATQSTVPTKCCLAARIFSLDSRFYIPILFDSAEFQKVILVMDLSTVLTERAASITVSNPSFVARIAPGEIAAYSGANAGYVEGQFLSGRPQQRVPFCASSFIPFLRYDGNTRLAGGDDRTPFALSRLSLTSGGQLGHASYRGLTYLAGAMPLMVDGPNLVEEGFHWPPEAYQSDIDVVATNAGFYNFPAVGTYSIAFTYAWEDAQGNWHESGPSKTYTVATTLGNLGINSTILTPPTQKPNAQLLMYRTLKDSTDTTLYLAHSVPLGATTTMSEANLPTSEVLYTEGGVLPNAPMWSCRQLSVFQRRLVAVGGIDGRDVRWSKQDSPGFPAEFTSDLSFQTVTPAALGKTVGAVELDDKLIIACESGIGAIYGQGPAPTGTQGQYSDFATLVTETGARWDSPKSIIRGPEGVWFRSPFGIRLLSRGGGLARGQDGKQVGAEVDPLVAWNDKVVAVSGNAKDSTVGESKQQIKFYLSSSGNVLVWDYQWGQWTRYTGAANIDAVYAGANAYHVKNVSTTPLVRYFDASTYTDVNDSGTTAQAFTSTITTGWLSFAGIQGFQRIYRLMLLGSVDSLDPQTITGSFLYDFTSTVGDSFTSNISPPASLNIQAQHHFAKQKCEAMKMTITFKPQTTTDEGRFRLTDLTLQVGVKGGYFKVPSASRV